MSAIGSATAFGLVRGLAFDTPARLTEPGAIVRGRNFLRIWRGRIVFRKHLWRLLRDKPELIEDMGLTIERAERELKKPFWRPSIVPIEDAPYG